MNRSKIISILIANLLIISALNLNATENKELAVAISSSTALTNKAETETIAVKKFQKFTGKIQGNRVRLRLDPNLDGKILRELNQDDLFVVLGEENDYFAVKPPSDLKAYVYRTFVLDGVIEGSKVNVRLEPHLESPVIAQLNTGYPIKGIVSAVNSKWLEIQVPKSTRFYIAREFVTFAGEESLLANLEQRRNEVHHLVNSAYLIAQAELRKNFTEIDFIRVEKAFENIIAEYPDFPNHVVKSEKVLNLVRETYLKKKIAFLESKTQKSAQNWTQKSQTLSKEIAAYEKRLADLEKDLSLLPIEPISPVSQKKLIPQEGEKVLQSTPIVKKSEKAPPEIAKKPTNDNHLTIIPSLPLKNTEILSESTNGTNIWAPIEQALFHQWAANNPGKSGNDFALEEKLNEKVLTGIIETYTRPVKNRPGDFLLKGNKRTLAFLYSTKVDLQSILGQKVTIRVNERPNNNFAFPAFHVSSAE